MESSKNDYKTQNEKGGENPEAERHCAYCNRPIRHGQTYYYCRLCGKGPLCNNHFYGDDGCAFCKPKRKKFPKWGIALIVIAVLAIGTGVWYLIDSSSPPPYYPPPPATSEPGASPPTTTTYYSLSTGVSPSGSGSVTPSSGTYDAGRTVSLTAHPNSGYKFNYWGGDVPVSHETDNPLTITMDSYKHVTAYFREEIVQYTLYTDVNPSGSGSVTPSGGTYEAGSTVQLEAHANAGCKFDRWGGDASGSSDSTSIIMDRNKSVTAYFVKCQRIKLHMPGTILNPYHIGFSKYLYQDEDVTGFVEWEHEYVYGWLFEVLDPEGNVIPNIGSGTHLHWDFNFTASHPGEYTIRLTNNSDILPPSGVMEICPSGWRQTEY